MLTVNDITALPILVQRTQHENNSNSIDLVGVATRETKLSGIVKKGDNSITNGCNIESISYEKHYANSVDTRYDTSKGSLESLELSSTQMNRTIVRVGIFVKRNYG